MKFERPRRREPIAMETNSAALECIRSQEASSASYCIVRSDKLRRFAKARPELGNKTAPTKAKARSCTRATNCSAKEADQEDRSNLSNQISQILDANSRLDCHLLPPKPKVGRCKLPDAVTSHSDQFAVLANASTQREEYKRQSRKTTKSVWSANSPNSGQECAQLRHGLSSFRLLLLATILLNLIDWQDSCLSPSGHSNQITPAPRSDSAVQFVLGALVALVSAPTLLLSSSKGSLLAEAQQYKPEWPHKSLEQEIFLLNLEDGYFGCQVNSSQDFLQLFELSRLCDGQSQCYLGTDELTGPLKCKQRQECATQTNSRGQKETVECLNGVCLDGLCYCNDGFGGKSCDIPDENECKFRPCDVFAHCTNTMGSYYCSCFPGYDGDGMRCQDINECEIPSLKALCSDNSECVNLPGHFVCKCKTGYQQSGQSQSSLTGAPVGNATVQCTDIDECLDERACGRGALCENLPGSFRCACPPGFAGDPTVECFDMDECRNSPCGVGAQCTNMPGGYRCSCAQGFEKSPRAPQGLFASLQTSSSALEFANNSLVACLDVNECAAGAANRSVCGANAQCVNTPGAYFCQCPTGFTGNPKVSCQDVDECALQACGPNALCSNTQGGFKCECKPGYTGNAYSPDGCQDEDECLRRDACGLNAQCFNTLGSFQCSCQSGYSGDPTTKCVDIDECRTPAGNPCGLGAQCNNLDGGYKCTCPDKYLARGTPEMGCERAAVDVGCAGDFECTQNAVCVNSTCQCKLGYQVSGIECADVDECSVSAQQQQLQQQLSAPVKAFTRLSFAPTTAAPANSSLCGQEALCINTDGSYRCDCKAGYEKLNAALPISKCLDVNECERSTPCGQNSKCFNTDGAFKCLCNEGFVQIDPSEPNAGCKSPCDGVNCGQHATCKPHGEEAACVCKPGFTFDPNNIKLGCVDINECDTNYGPAGLCGQRANCTNLPGSYRCHCPAGYAGDAYRYCEDVNECDRKFGVFGQCGELAVCTNKPGSFACACAQGYAGDPKVKCADVDECSSRFGPSGKCGKEALCTNLPGRYTCRCPPNYSGDPHDRCVPDQPPCSTSADCGPNQVCQSGRCSCPFAAAPTKAGGADPAAEANSSGGGGGECKHPCERTECGTRASCQLDAENQPVCVCDAGFMAPSDGRSGCVDVNECIQGATLSGVTPISSLSATGGAAIALGPTTLAPPTNGAPHNASGGHPCGRNAICHNLPGTFDCACPPGYTGNAYEACTLDAVRSQQTTTTNTAATSANIESSSAQRDGQQQFAQTGSYQQEPRTSACQEQCARGQFCFDGQCTRPDACRSSQDCRQTSACEHVDSLLGFQCVNVCESAQCGPNAKCTPIGHKPICACNATAGFAGDPYDLANGCRLQQQFGGQQLKQTTLLPQTTYDLVSQPPQQTSTTAQFQQQQQGDISTVSLERPAGGGQLQVQTTATTATLSQHNFSLAANMDQLKRQQVLGEQNKGARPNQPLIAYELPLPLPAPTQPQQFGADQFETSAGEFNGRQNATSGQLGQQQLTQTTVSSFQDYTTTTTATSGQDVASNKRKQPSDVSASNNQQQDVFSSTSTTAAAAADEAKTLSEQRQVATEGAKTSQQQQVAAERDAHNSQQLNTKSSANLTTTTSNYLANQVACTNDQHCPGNLFCLGAPQDFFGPAAAGELVPFERTRKTCGCPSGYRREGDYCFMHRVVCFSAAACKAREECVPASLLRQQQQQQTTTAYLTQTTISQQFSLGSQRDELVGGANLAGLCICPRGYKLAGSGVACIDRNECDEGTPCAVGASCQNKIGSYECVCPPGTIGEPYTKTCEPVSRADECKSNAECPNDKECDLSARRCVSPCHVCGPRAICTAANHAAICLCPPRFVGNAIDQIYGCQEQPQTTTTTTPPQTTTVATLTQTTTTTAAPTTTARATQTTTRPISIGVPQTTTLAPLETTTPELVEFRTIPPSELFVMCLADGIQVELQLGGFDGIIYVKGHSQDPKCRKLVMSSSANEFVDFKVQFGHCDLIHRDGEAGFVLVIQKHPKLVTYRARAYHVKCVYNTGERTVTLGFNVSMITTSGTIANTGPPPTCLMSITALDGREVTSAEIGQDLLLRVDVQPDSIYGGFARSCEAKTMDDEGEYQYEVTDANGCATDPSIFSDWQYDTHRKSLVARFNAFKFPSSNNLRFQCNIRVCFGSCPAVNCNGIDAYGKRRRRREAPPAIGGPNSTTTLDESEQADELVVTDSFKEGTLREEIMVQSNAILTFDKKETSLPQQQRPPVEDIEFVCLPRLGVFMSIALTTLLALLALAIGTSCWCFAKRKRHIRAKGVNGPLPHPMDFPNPLLRSPSASTLRDSIYGP